MAHQHADGTSRSCRRRPVGLLLTMVLALLGSLVVGLAPAPAAAALTPTRPLNVLLLGDSYAAGNGARDVVGDRTYSGVEGCYRSTTNWASQYVGLLRRSGQEVRFQNKACSGAVTRDMLADRTLDEGEAFQAIAGTYRDEADPAVAAEVERITRCSSRAVTDPVEEYHRLVITSVAPSTTGTTGVRYECQRRIQRQLDWVTPDIDLVLMTMGGNDIEFDSIVQQCFVPLNRNVGQCREQLQTSRDALAPALGRLQEIVAQMDEELRPDARVALLSYPLLEQHDDYTLRSLTGSFRAGEVVRDLGRFAVQQQAGAVAAANAAAGRPLVTFVPQTPEVFAGHEPDARVRVTNPVRWVYEVPPGDTLKILLEYYHPNPAGHEAIAEMLFGYGTFGAGASAPRNDIDVVFVVDTTGSMSPTIADVRAYASQVARQLAAGSNSYRFSLVDYRDFPARTGSSTDYPSRLVVPFTDDLAALQAGLDRLQASGGGDIPESAWSGIMTGLDQPWRPGVQKVLIAMSDAGPLDPEPFTGFTADQVVQRAFEIDPVQIYTVNTVSWSSAADALAGVATRTGGAHYRAAQGVSIPEAITSAIGTALERPSAWLDGPVHTRTGKAATLSALGSYSTDGSALTYAWDFTGDGTYDRTTTTPTTTYTSDVPVEGLLTLRVTDGTGTTALATTPLRVTRDGDAVAGDQDNCPDEWNDDQGDRDGDGLGDACDSTPGDERSNGTQDDGGDAPGGEEPAPDLDGDSTPARVTSFAPLNVRTSSTLLSDTDVDHVGFELDEPARVQALLGGLTADFDLAVLDRDGTLLALASQDTTRSERAVLDLPAGRYLLRVTARSGETSDRPYQLQATRLGR